MLFRSTSADYAYVADFDDGLRVIDVSNPLFSSEVGFYDTGDLAHDVAVSGDYAYVADGSDGLYILRFEQPDTSHFTPVASTGVSSPVVINHAIIDTSSIQPADEIGIFADPPSVETGTPSGRERV